MAVLQGDLASLGELVVEGRGLGHQGGDLAFVGCDDWCGYALQGTVGVLEVAKLFAEGGECSSEPIFSR